MVARVSCASLTAWLLSAGCAGPSAASWVPKLDLRCVANHVQTDRLGSDREGGAHDWDLTWSAFLRWQPKIAAQQVPSRLELAPETWIAPCDEDDPICLSEAAQAEAELARALGELQ